MTGTQSTLTPAPSGTFVQSLARGLAVIRSFSAAAPRQTLSMVALRTGLPRAAARRFLLTLEQLGYVRHDGRLFELTPAARSIAWQAPLSEPQILEIDDDVMAEPRGYCVKFARAIERAHGIGD